MDEQNHTYQEAILKSRLTVEHYKVVIFLLFLSFFTIPGEIPGIGISLEYSKQLFIIGVGALIVIWKHPKMTRSISFYLVISCFILMVLYFSLTLLWSVSLINSLRYINKVWLSLTLTLIFLSQNGEDISRTVSSLNFIIIAYALLSVFGELFLVEYLHPRFQTDPRFVGFGGIHSTKYLMSVGSIYFLVFFLFFRKKLLLFSFLLCFTIALLSLQRALIAGLITSIGLIFLIYLIRERKFRILIASLILGCFLIFLAFFLVFRFDPIKNRMFYTDKHAQVAETLLFSGKIFQIYDLIQKKGRENFWLAAENNQSPYKGNGFGTSGFMVEKAIGEYWEMHNDYLKLYVETGYIGVTLYAVFISVFILGASRGAIKSKNRLATCLFFISVGVFVITPLNGIFDNALDHIAKNICYSLLFFISAHKVENFYQMKKKYESI
ncbi:O-antigen ligase family protein [Ekhidna sp.]|uniref:O-antigen ligase family protein n=1 Tax=Ekhidna sp. TaxID=2608089 RepID=UPI003CCBD872